MKNTYKTIIASLILVSSASAFSKPMHNTVSREERMEKALDHYRTKVSHKPNYTQFVHCENVQNMKRKKVKLSCVPITDSMQ